MELVRARCAAISACLTLPTPKKEQGPLKHPCTQECRSPVSVCPLRFWRRPVTEPVRCGGSSGRSTSNYPLLRLRSAWDFVHRSDLFGRMTEYDPRQLRWWLGRAGEGPGEGSLTLSGRSKNSVAYSVGGTPITDTSCSVSNDQSCIFTPILGLHRTCNRVFSG